MMNRLIGILVVVAVGVLAYPIFFKPREASLQTEAMVSPPFPDERLQSETVRALEGREKLSKLHLQLKQHLNKAGKEISSKESSKENSVAMQALKTNLINGAWVIQVGTFKNKVNALRLVNQLRDKGYNAFFHQKSAAFGELMHVYVGPENKRDKLELLSTKLAREAQIHGVIKNYKLLTV